MFLILDSNNVIAAVSGDALYTKRQDNGVPVICPESEGDSILANDRFYPLNPEGYERGRHTLAEVEAVPEWVEPGYHSYNGEFYITDEDQARLDLDKVAAAAPMAASIAFVKLVENELIDDITAAEHCDLFASWTENWTGKRGQIVRDEGVLYKAIHDILVSAQNGKPKDTPSIWKAIGDLGEEWPAWSQVIAGVDTPYMTGDKVSHNGKHWISDIDGNVWQPGVYGWTLQKE